MTIPSLVSVREKRVIQSIQEAASYGSSDKAMTLILAYLQKRFGEIHQMPGVEHYKNSRGEGYGLRYFTSNGKSFRFNWGDSEKGSSKTIDSIDVWTGSSHDPNAQIQTHGISLTKILPSLADLIARPQMGDITVVTESAVKQGKILNEARAGADPEVVLEELIELFLSGNTFSEHKITQLGRTTGASLWRKILKIQPELFTIERVGSKTLYNIVDGTTEESFKREEILGATVTLSVEMGANAERYTSPEMRRLEGEAREANAIPYEDQLEDLNKLVKAIARGASNALFVGGKGGSGKTFQIEKALSELGMSDGSGYFKNTTSASASGMYKALYDNRDSIILFDDCDAVFKDQESRNILKAATDTKKDRKLAWMKNAFWIYKGNPADLEAKQDQKDDEDRDIFADDPDDDDGDKKYPRYFTFRGRIIFVSNLQLDQLDPDGALRTRGFVISINPTNEETLAFMEKILDKIQLEDGLKLDRTGREKVLEIITSGHNKADMNMRKLVRGMNMAAAGIPGWESLVSRYA